METVTPVEFDVLIQGGQLVSAASAEYIDLAILEGRIVELLAPKSEASARKVIDATGMLILPGGIDTHTHVKWPYAATVSLDNFDSATRAAALGGTTTIVDFVPPPLQNQSLVDACIARIAQINEGSHIDVALHPILTRADQETLEGIQTVVEMGLTSFKMYTTFENQRLNEDEIWRLTREIARHGGLPGFHAENQAIIEKSEHLLEPSHQFSVADFPLSRPGLAEAVAIKAIATIARALDTPIYVFHVSGSEAFQAIEEARALGSIVYAETCPHYLVFDESVYVSDDSWKFTICPPIRSERDQAQLWEGIRDRKIDTIGSDHCAYPVADKRRHLNDHRLNPVGAAGIQNRTPVLWNETVNVRGLTASDFVRISSEGAARILGMYPQKGTLSVGSDADIVILDPKASWTGAYFLGAAADTFDLYETYVGHGIPVHVLVRGVTVVENKEFVGTLSGNFVKRRAI